MHIQKYIFPLILTLSLCIPAYATETEGDATDTPTETVVEETPVEEEVVDDAPAVDENTDDSGTSGDWDSGAYTGGDSSLLGDTTLVGVETYGLSPVTPSDTTGLKSVLLEFIGDYDPVIVEYEYENSNGYNSFIREIQPDYAWLASCGILALFVLSLFKLGGALLCRR